MEGQNLISRMDDGIVLGQPQTIQLGQTQTLTLPPNFQLAPGTVLTLENGQILQVPSLRVQQPQNLLISGAENQLISLPISMGLDQHIGNDQIAFINNADNFETIVINEGDLSNRFQLTRSEDQTLNETPQFENTPTNIQGAEVSVDVVEQEGLNEQKRKPGRPKREENKFEKPIGKGPYLCKTCGLEFDGWANCKRHMKSHELDRKYRCGECGATYNLEKNLMLHIAGHQTGDKLVCPECGKTFARQASLKCHLAIHEEDDNLICGECGEEFPTEKQIESHKEVHHSSGNTDSKLNKHNHEKNDEFSRIVQPFLEENNTEQKKASFVCKTCSKVCESSKAFKEHQLKHKKLKSSLELIKKGYKTITRDGFKLSCKYCKKKFSKPSQVVRHERIHTGVRPYKCQECGKAFTQKQSLDSHTLKHTGQKPYACSFCSMKFSQRGNLRAHILRVHNIEGDERFKCSHCTCVFKKLGSLNAHISRFHPDLDHDDLVQLELDPEDSVIGQVAKSDIESEESEDLLSKAIQSAISTGIPGQSIPQPQESSDNDVQGQMVLADRKGNGKVRKHLVKTRTRNQIRYYICNFCTREFRKPSDLIRHVRIHTQEKPFKCQHCSRAFTVKSTLLTHLKIHQHLSQRQKPPCNKCGKIFHSHAAYKVHLKQHENPIPCEQCNETFLTTGSLNEHKQDVHKDYKIKKKDPNDFSDIQLQEPLIITNQGLLQNAPRFSSVYNPTEGELMQRQYHCNYCTAVFKKSSHLKQHTRSHTGERPFVCFKCSKQFISRGSLNSHLRTHEGTRLFQCGECSLVFTTAGSVRRHMAVHQEERPFMCPYCEKTFKTNVNCKKHMKTHVGNLTAQNPIGKYPPQIIIENPANLHSETVTTESIPGSSDISEISDAHATQPTIVYKYLSDTPVPSQLGARMYTADETGTITLAENSNQEINANQNFTMGISSQQTLSTNIASSLISLESSANLSPKSFNAVQLQDDIQNSTQLSSQPFNDSNSLLNQSYMTKDSFDENQKTVEHEHMNQSTCETSNVVGKQNDLLIHYENHGPVTSEYSQVMTTVSNDGVLALNPSDFGMDMSQLQIPLSQDSAQEINQMVRMDETSAISNTLENIELEKKEMHNDMPTAIQSVINENGNVLNTEQILKCGNCGEEFTDLPKMKRHFEIHHQIEETDPPPRKERHKCRKCTDVFANAQELKSHESTHDEEPKTYVCEICNAKFSSNSSYVRHQNVHNDKPFKCGHDGCLESYRTVGSLTKHNMGAHGGDPGQFNNAAFRKRTGAHIKLSEEQTRALAETPVELAKTISEKMLLSSAAEKIKADNPIDTEPVKEVHANQCDQCDVSFKKPSDLVRHVRTHTGEKPYGCDVCERRFAVKSTLRTHMKVHTGGKSLVCHVCQSLFASRTSLKVHMRLHTGSLPYKCNLCSKKFRTPAHRKTHVNNHCRSTEENQSKKDDMIPLTISAESLTAALEAVSSSGAPLIGATVQLQLHGHGFESAMTQLQIDEELLSQLRKGENINISISQMQLNQGKKKLIEQQLQTLPDINLNGDQTGITNEEQSNITPNATITSTHGVTKQSSDLLDSSENETSDILSQQHHSLVLPETPLLLSGTEQLILPLNQQESSILRSSIHDPSMLSSIGHTQELLNSASENQETISTIPVSQSIVSHVKHSNSMIGQSLLLAPRSDSSVKQSTSGMSERVILLPSGSHSDMLEGMGSTDSLSTTEREILVSNLDNEATESLSTELNYSVSTDENGRILDIQPGGDTQESQEEKVLNLTVTQYENDLVENSAGSLHLPLLDQMDISQVYICPWCDRVFRTEKDRIEHLLSGHGVEVKEDVVTEVGIEEPGQNNTKEKICSVCDKKFMKPSQLVRHMRVHTGERPFACLMCRKSFNQKNALQIHMKKHTGERPYVCPFCQYAFTQKGNLKTHIQRSHAEIAQQLIQKSMQEQGQDGLLAEKTNIAVATEQGGTISIDLADLLGPVLK